MGEHANVARIRQALHVYNSGEHAAMRDVLAQDILWHVGGDHPMSGDYRGQDAVIDYFDRVRELTSGSLRVEPVEILANDRHASIFMMVSAKRDGRRMNVLLAEALALGSDGLWREYWALADDQDAVDAFWA
jgi:ketosteroid isomerase-like protein